MVEDQFDNIRAAWERAILAENVDQVVRIAGGLFMYNHTRRLPEIYQWVEQALALPDSHGHRLARHARLHRAYGMFMNAQGAVSEAEIRAVLAEGADDFDPLRPLGLCVLTQALYNLGRFQETAELAREAENCARRGGPDYDYDLAEALFNRCAVALFQDAPDREAADEYLELARALGNARALGAL